MPPSEKELPKKHKTFRPHPVPLETVDGVRNSANAYAVKTC